VRSSKNFVGDLTINATRIGSKTGEKKKTTAYMDRAGGKSVYSSEQLLFQVTFRKGISGKC